TSRTRRRWVPPGPLRWPARAGSAGPAGSRRSLTGRLLWLGRPQWLPHTSGPRWRVRLSSGAGLFPPGGTGKRGDSALGRAAAGKPEADHDPLHDQVRASQSPGHSCSPDSDVCPCDGGAGRRDRPLAYCHERTQSTQDPHNHPSLPSRWQL
ncbi:hypothetical protein Nmel_005413, partial [Mimus melanotis]